VNLWLNGVRVRVRVRVCVRVHASLLGACPTVPSKQLGR